MGLASKSICMPKIVELAIKLFFSKAALEATFFENALAATSVDYIALTVNFVT